MFDPRSIHVFEFAVRSMAWVSLCGFGAAYLFSPWSPIPAAIRSRCALAASVVLAIVSLNIPAVTDEGPTQYLQFGVLSAFGLVFAISRIRTVPRHASFFGWPCAALHSLLLWIACSELGPFD